KTLTTAEIFKIFLYGLRMDASFAAYICIFPFLLFFIKSVARNLRINKIIRIYTTVLIVIITFLITADLELYNAWGYRMDATPLQYFKTPKEMGATISSAPLFLLLLILIFLSKEIKKHFTSMMFLFRYFSLQYSLFRFVAAFKKYR